VSSLDQRLKDNLALYTENAEKIRTMKQETEVSGVSIPVPGEVKRAALRDLYEHHRQVYEQLAAAKRQEVADNLTKARQQLFKYRTGMGVDHVEISLSQRDAEDRLAGITDPNELRTRLETAHELGDDVMARAILRRGVSLGEDFGGADIVRQYLSLYPGQQDAYTALEDAAMEATRLEQMGVGGTILNPEDAARTFSGMSGSSAGGLIPDSFTSEGDGSQ
jgi:hypothetical protein